MNSKSCQLCLAAFSLAALLFLPAWTRILNHIPYFDYPGFQFDPYAPIVTLIWMLIATLLLAILLHVSSGVSLSVKDVAQVDRIKSKGYLQILCSIVVAACLLMALNNIFVELGIKKLILDSLSSMIGGVVAGGVVCTLALGALLKYSHKCWIFLQHFLIVLSPFAFIVTAKALWSLLPLYEAPEESSINIARPSNAPRIIWMIFDELDIRLSFEDRMNLALPNLDRLKAESLFTTQAYSAGSDTMSSIPSMISGLNLKFEFVLNDHNASFTNLQTNQGVDWYDIPNIFEKAKGKGLQSAVIGNYHPYQKLLGKYLHYSFPQCVPKTSFFQKFKLLSRQMFVNGIPLIRRLYFKDSLIRSQMTNCYFNIFHHARVVCLDPEYDFVFIHWPIPHHPGIYNSATKEFFPESSSYFDNLQLVDDTLGQITKDMQEAGLWNSTTIIVTSDHWLRKHMIDKSCCDAFDPSLKEFMCRSDFRVPLLVKLANQHEPITYPDKVRLYNLHSMIENIQNGNIITPADLAAWMKSIEEHFTLAGLENR